MYFNTQLPDYNYTNIYGKFQLISNDFCCENKFICFDNIKAVYVLHKNTPKHYCASVCEKSYHYRVIIVCHQLVCPFHKCY